MSLKNVNFVKENCCDNENENKDAPPQKLIFLHYFLKSKEEISCRDLNNDKKYLF